METQIILNAIHTLTGLLSLDSISDALRKETEAKIAELVKKIPA
jgi:hypothetical protein